MQGRSWDYARRRRHSVAHLNAKFSPQYGSKPGREPGGLVTHPVVTPATTTTTGWTGAKGDDLPRAGPAGSRPELARTALHSREKGATGKYRWRHQQKAGHYRRQSRGPFESSMARRWCVTTEQSQVHKEPRASQLWISPPSRRPGPVYLSVPFNIGPGPRPSSGPAPQFTFQHLCVDGVRDPVMDC